MAIRKYGKEAGIIHAQTSMGKRYLEGIYVQEDRAEGMRLLQASADQRDSRAQEILGEEYLSHPDDKTDILKGKRLLEMVPSLKSPNACYVLGLLYFGEEVLDEHDDIVGYKNQDLPKAMEFLTLAAHKKDPQAIEFLGMQYLNRWDKVNSLPLNIREGERLLRSLPQWWNEGLDITHTLTTLKTRD
jgi:TPR repeat protein